MGIFLSCFQINEEIIDNQIFTEPIDYYFIEIDEEYLYNDKEYLSFTD